MNRTNPIETLKRKIDENSLWETSIELKRNDFLVKTNQKVSDLYFVEKGSLRIFILSQNDDYTIRFGYQNSFITALDSFFSNQPTVYSIQVIKHSILKVISRKSFEYLLNQDSENLRLWNEILTQLNLQQMEREIDLLQDSPIDRYKRVLLRSPKLFQEIPNKYIASYLRMTPETLSRLKKS